MARCKIDELIAAAKENRIVGDHQCISAVLDDALESAIDLRFAAGSQKKNLLSTDDAAFRTSWISVSALGLVGFTSMAVAPARAATLAFLAPIRT